MKPERVFYYFRKISDIPRSSGNEKAVSDYLKSVGESLGLKTVQDEYLNVYIMKPASKGCENAPGVIIQGHMDMVCEKSTLSTHDFTKDPIKWVEKDGRIYGDSTTLGADNGIALAMALAILEDDTIVHPQLEVLMTTSEETEMDGALNLSADLLKGKYLLNIDSEEEGILTLGSAGGELYTAHLYPEYSEGQHHLVRVHFDGFLGGHSGMEIHKNRKNMIKVITSFLLEYNIALSDICVGTKDNAIPRSGYVIIEDVDNLEKYISDFSSRYVGEEPLLISIEDRFSGKVFSDSFREKLLSLLNDLPTGVHSKDDTGIISSSNLAVISESEDGYSVLDSIRSSDNTVLKIMENDFKAISDNLDVDYDFSAAYPSWEKKEHSKLQEIANEVYSDMYGKKFENIVIHAGLECGAIYEKYPDLEIISFGPDITGAHTPGESLSIASTERVYDYTVKLIEKIAGMKEQ